MECGNKGEPEPSAESIDLSYNTPVFQITVHVLVGLTRRRHRTTGRSHRLSVRRDGDGFDDRPAWWSCRPVELVPNHSVNLSLTLHHDRRYSRSRSAALRSGGLRLSRRVPSPTMTFARVLGTVVAVTIGLLAVGAVLIVGPSWLNRLHLTDGLPLSCQCQEPLDQCVHPVK